MGTFSPGLHSCGASIPHSWAMLKRRLFVLSSLIPLAAPSSHELAAGHKLRLDPKPKTLGLEDLSLLAGISCSCRMEGNRRPPPSATTPALQRPAGRVPNQFPVSVRGGHSRANAFGIWSAAFAKLLILEAEICDEGAAICVHVERD